jgi:hypothetical protein
MARVSERERMVIQTCLQNLRALEGCQVEFVPEHPPESPRGQLTLHGAWGSIAYRAVTWLRLSRATLQPALQLLKNEPDQIPTLLLTDYLPETLAQHFRRAGAEFIDAAGNAHLGRPPLYVEIAGRKRPQPAGRRGRAFETAGLKLVYLFLRHPEALEWTYRKLAAEAGIALGAVGAVFAQLDDLHYTRRNGADEKHLWRKQELLQRWELGYCEKLRPKLQLRRCRLPADLSVAEIPERIVDLGLGDEALLGGELGASLLVDHPQPKGVTLHVTGDVLRLMLRMRLVADPEGEVELVRSFGHGNAWSGWKPEGLNLADPLLMHAEIERDPDADTEVRQKLMTRYLLPRLLGEDVE